MFPKRMARTRPAWIATYISPRDPNSNPGDVEMVFWMAEDMSMLDREALILSRRGVNDSMMVPRVIGGDGGVASLRSPLLF